MCIVSQKFIRKLLTASVQRHANECMKGLKKLIRFEHFGKTRWFSNEKSLTKIFGTYTETDIEVYLALLKFLYNIKTGPSFEASHI